VLASQPLADMPPSLEERQRLLLDYLRDERALLVLDNLESLLEERERAGPGRVREGYARLLRAVAQTEHQSCLLLTSREKPGELVHLEGSRAPVRSLRLSGLEALRRRSLVERGKQPGSFTLQSVVLEYATERLINEVADDIEQGHLAHLVEHGLELATSREYVRQTQQRLLVAPLLAQLRRRYQGRDEVEEHLLALLSQLRARADYAQGYGPANVLALLCKERGHLRGLDLSQLVLRGVHLQGVEMQDASLSGALLQESVFRETFDAITAVTISPDGHYWAASGRRGEVRVWAWEQAAGPTLHRVWQAHTDMTHALAFSPDGHHLASGSWDGTLKLWDIESGVLRWSSWHPHGVQSLALAPDRSLLATDGNDATVRIWDLQTGTQVQTLPHPGPIFSVAWSPDGNRLATGGFDGLIRLWDIPPTGPAIWVRTLSEHSNWVLEWPLPPMGGP
jgi:hypothetical protein